MVMLFSSNIIVYLKWIFADTEDTREGVRKKLRLLLFLPRSRAKRLLNQWSHPVSLMIRAREHALNVLSGVEGTQARGHPAQKAKTTYVSTRGNMLEKTTNKLPQIFCVNAMDIILARTQVTGTSIVN
jgi:hypothetical protein